MAISSRMRKIKRGVLEIPPNLYQLTVRGVNIILIVEEELTLIDAGLPGSSAQIAKFIRSLGRSVEEVALIIVTHNHLDHVGGLAELRGLTRAKVAVHQADIDDSGRQMLYPGVIQKLLRAQLFSVLRPVFSVEPGEDDIRLVGGEVLKPLGGLKVVPTPGHTPGSISLYSLPKKLLIVGDALNKHGSTLRLPPKMVSIDLLQAIDSVSKMAQLDVEILCVGHGQPLTADVPLRIKELLAKVGVDNVRRN